MNEELRKGIGGLLIVCALLFGMFYFGEYTGFATFDPTDNSTNDTINLEINETEFNESLIENVTNITIEEEISETKIKVSNKAEIIEEIEEPTQQGITINEPVRWLKTIRFDGYSDNVKVEIPFNAQDITLQKVEDGIREDIGEENFKVVEEGMVKEFSQITGQSILEIEPKEHLTSFLGSIHNFVTSFFKDGGITGFIAKKVIKINVGDLNLSEAIVKASLNDKVWEFNSEDLLIDDKIVLNLSNLDINETGDMYIDVISDGTVVESKKVLISDYEKIVGEVNETSVEETPGDNWVNETKSIIIAEPVKEVEIGYTLPGPEIFEEYKSDGKIVTIFSDVYYENILAYSTIEETDIEGIKLYWLQEGIKTLVTDVTYLDENNNELIDKIAWIVPHLSNQTYEIDLTVLNIQSYPTVGGNWTVGFNTTGIANLTITAFNGTTWVNTNESLYDLNFLELLCENNGVNETISTTWQGGNCSQSGSCSVFVEDYSCNGISNEVSKVLTEGDHYLKFKFGTIIRYAKNLAGEFGGLAGGSNGTINLVTGAFGYTGINQTDGGYTIHTHGLLGPGKNVTSGSYTLGLGYIYMLDIVMSVFINLISPVDNEVLNNAPSFTYYPSADEIHSCKLYGNWTSDWHLNQTDYGVTPYSNNQFSLSELEEGLFYWNVECNNSQGNFFSEDNLTFRYNLAPNTPDLNAPLNNTYWRLNIPEFNWSNSSDDAGDDIYYYLEIDDSIDFDSINYANSNVAETANVTSDGSVSGLGTGDYWWRVLAYDDYGNSSWSEIRNFTVNTNILPEAPDLFLPTNETYMISRTPTFGWSNSSDANGDTLTYNIQVDGAIDFSSPEVDGFDVSTIAETANTTNWTATAELQEVDSIYYWRVRAHDGYEYGSWSEIRNFTIVGIVALDLVVDEIDFGILGPGITDDTSDNTPGPIVMRNSGNVGIDINVSLADSSESLWSTDTSPTNNYRYKVDNRTGEEGAFDWVESITSWTNIDVSNSSYKIKNLNYTDTTDEVELDIRITVPGDEPGGEKTSDLTITGVITGG